jgi:transcriptional regulator with XRE-family HTH domain
MQRIQGINVHRIEWCCQEQGTTPGQLAADVGISAATMNRVMANEAGLIYAQLKKIADYLGRGVLFFLEQEAVQPQNVYTPQFRTLTNQKPNMSAKVRLLIQRKTPPKAKQRSWRIEILSIAFMR